MSLALGIEEALKGISNFTLSRTVFLAEREFPMRLPWSSGILAIGMLSVPSLESVFPIVRW